ncbi:WD40/YVTN/BNR-like repeat-containing protein [Pseudidiomarina taiwanensis]|uniref:Oxidoreductase n=1 Tax=Pseudidiomarina taiwanensis TaxID=337250 RepID=A0A432ZK05_9GAMM|nr:hypothetical protein [Pseudidiomarina taiwanensis]RUO78298.1 hypothetical protein CWI83_04495 [Pseudidiomarina taiwanensis]
MATAWFTATALLAVSASAEALAYELTPLNLPNQVQWFGVSTPSRDVIWLSGADSMVARSIDGGVTWEVGKTGPSPLQLRDIEALDSDHAYALSIGKDGDSRIYYTNDGGQNWVLSYRGRGEQFLNCLAVSAKGEAWIYGDSIDGRWDMVRSADGRNWLPSRNAVDSQPLGGEGGLAASGACTRYNDGVWAMATANATTARVLIKRERGIRFKAVDTPMVAGPGAGIASIWPFSERHWLLAGGDLENPQREPRLLEYQNGEFRELPQAPIAGALYSLTVLPNNEVLVTNPNGAAILDSGYETWQVLSDSNIWNASCNGTSCFLVGKAGYVAKLTWSAD